jgi:hypothetical protein
MITKTLDSDCFVQLLPVLKRLQVQEAITEDTINVNQYPNIKILNEMMEKLFSPLKDTNINVIILSNLLGVENLVEACKNLNAKLSQIQVMNFSQLILYKSLPCPNGENCECLPREIATNNQYYDKELSCPFYHHYRDQRRVCINELLQEEFTYQANYFDEDKQQVGNKESYSQNYFESMFHPLYYKMFQCSRKYCKAAPYCPFYHAEDEKRIWGDNFLKFINKERVSYVKERKKSSQMSSTENSFISDSSPKSDIYCKTPKENKGSYTPLSNYSPFSTPRVGLGNNRRPLGRMDKIEKYCPNGQVQGLPIIKSQDSDNYIQEREYTNNNNGGGSSYSKQSDRRTTYVTKKLIKEIRVL